MPPSPAHIRTLLGDYLDRHPGEHGSLTGLRATLEAAVDPTSRTSLPGHVTCSVAVIDRDARGPEKGEAAHRHYDFRFVFHLADDAPDLTLQAEEVDGAAWLPFDEVASPTLRAKLVASGLDGAIRPVAASAATAAVAPVRASVGTVPHVVGAHLYLERAGHVLLGLRHPDSAYAGGTRHALAGHLGAEAATAGLVREAHEEAGLVIVPAGLELVHTVHLVDRPGDRPRIGLFFRARHWEGEPEVREPDKCVAWQRWSAKDLPEPIVPYTRAAIEGILAGRPYTEMGWSR